MDVLFTLEVRELPYFIAKGKIKQKDILTVNLAEIMTNLVNTDKKIRDAYKKYLADSRLVGQDKADILEDIIEMIINIVTLRMYIAGRIFNSTIVESRHKAKGFEMKIFLNRYEFLINGFLSVKTLEQLATFHYWDERYFMPLYDNLLDTFRMAVADGKITEEEGKGLADILEDMLHMLILIFHKLETTSINA